MPPDTSMHEPDIAPPSGRRATPRTLFGRLGETASRPRADADRLRLIDYLRLQPYRRSLLTPAAATWIGSARIMILLMATIEGFVWGAVGFSLVPTASAWLGPPVAAFLFALMFLVIWIIDASLIMSEKPSLNAQAGDQRLSAAAPILRWLLGLLVRVAIVAISLYVTAPFVEKLIRADDLATWHQGQVERYVEERAGALSAQVEARVAQRETGYRARIQGLEQQINAIDEALAAEREDRDRLRTEYQPELEVLAQDLAEARRRVGDEVLGREGRPEGYGPEARKWDTSAELLADTLANKRTELSERLAPTEARIDELQQRLDRLNSALTELRAQQQALVERITREVKAEQPPAAPPKLTFAAQSKGLDALRDSPAEQGVAHFETVEGFAQAALGILFFSLIALKLFEPPAVQAYYSETIQAQFRNYLNGGLADIPGFDHHDDPARRLTPVEFARRWQHWQHDPTAFVASRRAELEARAQLARLRADQAHERELLSRRREGIDHQLALEQRHREAELSARERELELRIEQMRVRLGDETSLQRERDKLRLAQERDEQVEAKAKAAHEQRGRLINAQQRQLEQLREQLATKREQQRRIAQEIAENQTTVSATRQAIEALEARLGTQQPALDALHGHLSSVEKERAAAGAFSRFGRLGRRAALLRRAISRAERSLQPDRQALSEHHGELDVIEFKVEQLQSALEDLRATELSLRHRCESERAALDALLLSASSTAESSRDVASHATGAELT